MSKKVLNDKDVIRLLKRQLRRGLTQQVLAKRIKVSQPYLCRLIAGKKKIGIAVLKYLNLEICYKKRRV